MFGPLPAQSALIDQVHDRLVAAIADGTLPPGHRLTQEEIAASLGVSRQPVSHALQVLRRRGLVTESGKRGLVVAPLDPQAMRDLYQVRAALEALTAQLAAERVRAGAITRADRDEGEHLLGDGAALDADASVSAMIAADVAFHAFLHRLSGNRVIVETITEQWPHFRRSMGVVLIDATVRARVWNEHAEILARVLAGKPADAAEAARRHIENATEETLQRLEAKPSAA